MNKIKIKSAPEENEPAESHFYPILEYLALKGNYPDIEQKFSHDKSGVTCYMTESVDFTDLLNHFEFPESITVNTTFGKITDHWYGIMMFANVMESETQ